MTFPGARTITRVMDEHDLTDRLRSLGEQPVPPATHQQHLRMLASTSSSRSERRFGRLAVAAAALVGFVAGSTGLAVAGALPDPAQDVAHDVLSVVQVDVPEGTRGACVSAAARDDSLTKEAEQAAKAACPRGGGRRPDGAPGRSGAAPGQAKQDDGDPCRGKPPWAGRMDPADKARLRAEHAAARAAAGCPVAADEPEEPELEEPEIEAEEERVEPGG